MIRDYVVVLPFSTSIPHFPLGAATAAAAAEAPTAAATQRVAQAVFVERSLRYDNATAIGYVEISSESPRDRTIVQKG